ncbi:hypothetical protein HYY75_01895 [bacterium]|nr:hypothetical protein [bacterium]
MSSSHLGVSSPSLGALRDRISALKDKERSWKYCVPGAWRPVGKLFEKTEPKSFVQPYSFFLEHVNAIEMYRSPLVTDPSGSINSQLSTGTGGSWVEKEIIYNLFVRLSTSFDHNQDGILGGSPKDISLNPEGIRESGTFLKSIALLGHIKNLGATTIHLLPVTTIGRDGNKGNLGSPYAIKNVYTLEPSLADPLVEMSVEEQFKAFVEACHMLGLRVICEFVFRTASKDADWVKEHPEWFYWIDAKIQDRNPQDVGEETQKLKYGNPVFSKEQLVSIKEKVSKCDFFGLPEPPVEYRRFFKLPPSKDKIKINEKGQYRGFSLDPENEEMVETRIPGAFADWPPDDTQPPWGDVTYLRMYLDENLEKPRFNYISYNTIRMYETTFAKKELANLGEF